MTDERLRRWRLILGADEADGINVDLSGADVGIDGALDALYDAPRAGSLGPSAPSVARWLGDIRKYFPSTVVQVMQKDALDRLGLTQMLLEPETLRAVEPDVHLVSTLLSLGSVLPAKTRDTAREVVRRVVEDLEKRLGSPMREAVTGSLARSVRNRRPRQREIDWDRTIRANLRHYQPALGTIVPERLVGFGRKGQSLRDIVLCIDQSGSMAPSVVYAGVFAAVLASLRAVETKVVAFDTSVVDLSHLIDDPVELLFGTRLGGGTDIERALAYSQGLVRRPDETIMILISDLYEGGSKDRLLKRVASIVASGVNLITLLALSDEGAPFYDHTVAAQFAALGVPAFACTPDAFPELMAAAIKRQDIHAWAERTFKA